MKGLALAVPARLAPAANAATPRRKHAPDRNERNVRWLLSKRTCKRSPEMASATARPLRNRAGPRQPRARPFAPGRIRRRASAAIVQEYENGRIRRECRRHVLV